MKKNLNRRDGFVRLLLGLACIAAFFMHLFGDELLETVIGIIGLILLASAVFEFCFIYYLLGIKTRHRRRNNLY
ncbi:YgaP family membrane protein [Flavobacterium sp. PLA-1-15]|uniref:YgaP family membrane protein n=1 Tax=Flavobacterium sp. PLA-1-15 TaxID=3380533 RepID=UPI003B77F941